MQNGQRKGQKLQKRDKCEKQPQTAKNMMEKNPTEIKWPTIQKPKKRQTLKYTDSPKSRRRPAKTFRQIYFTDMLKFNRKALCAALETHETLN